VPQVARQPDAVNFDAYELRLSTREFLKHGLRIKLPPQAFQVLQMLVERPGQLISREEFHRALWPADTFVDFDQGLNSAVKKIRDALNDSAETPRYIETLPRLGYRFVGEVNGRDSTDVLGPVDGNHASEEVSRNPMPVAPPARRQNLRLAIVSLAVVILVLVGSGIYLLSHRVPATNSSIRSIAVLPLENLSGDPDQEYLADGMTDELITHLAKLGSPRVISRTSVMRYKRALQPLPEIARALKVDAVVEGSIALSGNRVRVTVQLIRAADDQHLWAEEYDSEMGDMLALQRQIAGSIAQEVRAKLGPEQQTYFAARVSRDPVLNETYLRGLYFWEKRTEPDLRRAIENFNAAIARDPEFAPAYAGVANSYNLLWYLGFMRADEAVPQARAAIEKALALDPLSAEAHLARAYLFLHQDWNWAAGDAELRRTLDLSPGYSLAHQWNAYFLRAAGRSEEAVAESEIARELDPLSAMKTFRAAAALQGQGDDAAALRLIRRAMELDPSNSAPHYKLSELLQRQGLAAEAVAEWRTGLKLDGDLGVISRFDSTLGRTDLTAAKRAVARMLVERRLEQAKTRYVSPRVFVELYLQAGDNENGLRWLAKAFDEHSSFLVEIAHDPKYDGVA
jgi:TolB-like protein/DNA-binding winged helix-turn-helix (wHTH) protein/Tfp pilus assembly protein PilF